MTFKRARTNPHLLSGSSWKLRTTVENIYKGLEINTYKRLENRKEPTIARLVARYSIPTLLAKDPRSLERRHPAAWPHHWQECNGINRETASVGILEGLRFASRGRFDTDLMVLTAKPYAPRDTCYRCYEITSVVERDRIPLYRSRALSYASNP